MTPKTPPSSPPGEPEPPRPTPEIPASAAPAEAGGEEAVWDISEEAESNEDARAAAIAAVVEHAKRETRAVELARPMESYRGRPIVLALLAAASVALAAYTYVARPAWVFGPDPAVAAAGRRDAHLRYAMYLVAQRLTAWRDSHDGALPRTMREIGEDWTAITYRPLDGGAFELRSSASDGQPIVVRSGDHLPVLAVGIAERLRQETTP